MTEKLHVTKYNALYCDDSMNVSLCDVITPISDVITPINDVVNTLKTSKILRDLERHFQ